MKYTNLGSSDLKISQIGLGCMSLEPSNKESIKVIQTTIDKGINYFDTADLYNQGENEVLLGTALRHQRKNVYIASKVGNQLRKDGSGWDWNPSKAYIISAVEESLTRLKTDYIDFYQLHGGTIDDPIEESIEAFEQLVKEGKIRYYGISSIRPNVIRTYVDKSEIKGVMLQYSLLDRRPEEEILDLLKRNGIGVLVRGALAKGLLVNKTPKDYLSHSLENITQYQGLFKGKDIGNIHRSALALKFVISNKAVSSIIVGLRSFQQVEELFSAYEKIDELSEIENCFSFFPADKYADHR